LVAREISASDMSNKATEGKSSDQAATVAARPELAAGAVSHGSGEATPFAQLQRTLGNQAMLQLLESGVVQAKLHISQPGDADELEADRVASRIVSSSYAPVLHRKCSCAGAASCSKCSGEEEEKIHRSAAAPLSIQRHAADPAAPMRDVKRPAQLIAEDEATKLEHGQMKKSDFLALLKSSTTITADVALAVAGKSIKSGPYIEKWLASYEEQDGQHIERALTKYAPEAARAHTAREYVVIINNRVERAVITWAKTGKLTGVPEELVRQFSGGGGAGGFLGALQGFASSGIGGSILGFLGGGVQRKARNGGDTTAHDAASMQTQLGSGHALDSRVQSEMSSAFGYDFSHVKVHSDSQSAALSSSLDARAFTIGKNVAFASGEYQPGTMIGDALIAHELAHVVQQGGGRASTAAMAKSAGNTGQLEEDADLSAVGAVASMYAGGMQGLANLKQNAGPRLRSGLRLQRCSCSKEAAPPVKSPATATPTVQLSGNPAHWAQDVDLAKQAGDEAAMLTLVRQALGANIQVRLAGKANRTTVDAQDYAPAPTLNFDPLLNRKNPAGSSANLAIDNGYSFNHRGTSYAVLGPNAVDRRDPLFTKMYAEHELFHVTHHMQDAEPHDANHEVEAWTDNFVNYFHQFMHLQLPDRPVWKPLADYYERADAQHRQAAIARLRSYFQNPPVPNTDQDKVRKYIAGWIHRKLRDGDFPSKTLLNDMATFALPGQAGQTRPGTGPSRNP
jgi:hypothetical protein